MTPTLKAACADRAQRRANSQPARPADPLSTPNACRRRRGQLLMATVPRAGAGRAFVDRQIGPVDGGRCGLPSSALPVPASIAGKVGAGGCRGTSACGTTGNALSCRRRHSRPRMAPGRRFGAIRSFEWASQRAPPRPPVRTAPTSARIAAPHCPTIAECRCVVKAARCGRAAVSLEAGPRRPGGRWRSRYRRRSGSGDPRPSWIDAIAPASNASGRPDRHASTSTPAPGAWRASEDELNRRAVLEE